MNRKRKGISGERELIKHLWKSGFAAHRVAGSGSIGLPAPDIIAGNHSRKLAIECKIIKSDKKYFSLKEIEELKEFAKLFGAEPWLAVKFFKKDWLFFSPEDLVCSGKNYVLDVVKAEFKGLSLSEFLSPIKI